MTTLFILGASSLQAQEAQKIAVLDLGSIYLNSLAMKNLEEEMGFQILDRKGYRVRLSDKGQVFFEKAKLLLEEENNLKYVDHAFQEKLLESKIALIKKDIKEIEGKIADITKTLNKLKKS